VAAPSQVFAAASRSSPASAPCSCHPLAHETLLWHHRLGHPSLPRLQGMASHALGHERYFVLVVDDYSRYTTVFPLRSKDRGGEFSSDLLRAFCRSEGIRQTFTLPASPQQNGIAERRIGMVMDVARTSMIHAASPHFLWPFMVRYAEHQINLQPRVSLPKTTPTLRWTGKVGDASAFRVWGSQAFVRDTTADKLSSRAVPCIFLGFPPDAPGWQFYHPTSRRVLSFQDVTFDESVSYYYPAEPVEVAVDSGAESGGAESGGAEPADAGTGGAQSGGAASGRAVPGGAEPGRVEPEGTVSGGAEPARAASGGALGFPPRREPLSRQQLREWYSWLCQGAAGATEGIARASGGGACAGAAGGGAGAGAAGGAACAGAAGGAVGTRDLGAEGTGFVSAVSGGTMQLRRYYIPLLQQVLGFPPSPGPPPPSLSPPPVPTQSQGLLERREPQSRPFLLCLVLRRLSVRAGRVSRPHLPPVPGTHSMTLRPSTAPQRVPLPSPPASSLPAGPDPTSDSFHAARPAVTRFLATAVTDPLFESTSASALVAELVHFAAACRLDFATCLVSEFESACVCPPSVGGECALGTDVLEDRQEEFECFAASVPHQVSMLLAPEGDPDAPDIPTPRSYAEAIEGPYSSQWHAAMGAEMASWKSTRTYVDEVPPTGANIFSGMWIFRVKRPPGSPPVFKAHYVARGFSQRQGGNFFQTFSPAPKMTPLRVLLHVAAQRDFELHSLDFSTAFLQGSLHEEIWLCRPHGFTGTTLAALVFAPSTADPSLFLRTDATLPPFYVLVYADDLIFATADTEALAHVLQRFGFTYSSPQSTPLPTGHLLSAPPSDESVEPSGPYPELVGCLMYLMTCTRPDLAYPLSLLARYVAPGRHRKVHWDAAMRVLRYLCSTSGMGLMLGGRARAVLTGHADASWVDDLATQRSSQGYTFNLLSGSVSWPSTRSSSVLSSSCEAEIYAGAMAAQELRWLTYLLTDLGEAPRSPLVVYVDNKVMLALCQEHRTCKRLRTESMKIKGRNILKSSTIIQDRNVVVTRNVVDD
ncbi:unnamed protein product, partial [Closterium sp. NIES-53]